MAAPLDGAAVQAFLTRLRAEAHLCELNIRIGWRPEGSQTEFTLQKGAAHCKTRSRDVVLVSLRTQNDDTPIAAHLIKEKRFPFAGYEYNVLEVLEGRQNVLVSDDEEDKADEENGDDEDEVVEVVLHSVKTWHRQLESEAGPLVIRNFLLTHEELGMRDPTDAQRKLFALLEKWIRATAFVEGWRDCSSFVEIADGIVEFMRYQHVDRYSGQAEAVSRALYSSTHPDDKWGIMEKKLVKPKRPQANTAKAVKKAVRCFECKRVGHIAKDCPNAKQGAGAKKE
eukprot:PhM_4_TR16091/c2_g1_i8/m.90098